MSNSREIFILVLLIANRLYFFFKFIEALIEFGVMGVDCLEGVT